MVWTSVLQKLPVAIVVLIFLISVATIYLRFKNVNWRKVIDILKTTNYVQAWLLLLVFFLSGVFGVFNHFHSKQYSYAIVSLNYSEASQAKNSNGTRFSAADITCDKVVKKAIEKGALEEVGVKDLQECLSVKPYVQGDAFDENKYHISTEFLVEYKATKHTQHLNAENVINLLTSAYKDYYIEKFTYNFSLDTIDKKPDYSEMEYMDIVAYLDKEATSVLNYLYGMSEKSSSFVTSNNTTFYSISGKVYQFKQTQIEQNLRSLILQNGIARDKTSYIDRLNYQNENTDFHRRKNLVSFDLCNDAIAMYSEEMTRIVLVPTWDTSGKYYMGRTKVGIDELSVMATGFSNNVASNEKSIMDNELIMDKIKNASNKKSAKAAADELILSIDKSIDDFANEAVKASREYLSHTMNQCIAVNFSGGSVFREIKMIALFAAFTYGTLILYVMSKEFPKKKAK
jgi:hypothetical protein